MSTITAVTDNSNQLEVTYDVSKFLLGGNKFIESNVTASGDVVMLEGMIMGKIGSTGLLTPADKDATDGSQLPVGVCILTRTVADGTTEAITLVNKGKIAESKLNFLSTETLDTLIGAANNQRSYRDYLNDLGLILLTSNELTNI